MLNIKLLQVLILNLGVVVTTFGNTPEKITINNLSNKTAYFQYTNKFNDFISISIKPKNSAFVIDNLPIVLYTSTLDKTAFLFFKSDSVNLMIDNQNKYSFEAVKDPKRIISTYNLSEFKSNPFTIGHVDTPFSSNDIELSLWGRPLFRDSLLLNIYQTSLNNIGKHSPKLPDSLFRYMERHLHYNYLMEVARHLLLKNISEIGEGGSYKQSLVLSNRYLNCDDCINIATYRRFASNYLDYLFVEIPPDSLISYLDNHFEGKTKDFMLFLTMKNLSRNTKFFDLNLSKFLVLCSDSEYKYYIQSINESSNVKDLGSGKQLQKSTGETISIKNLLNANKDKVIYIDFWASWCNPCIDEMPYSIDLGKKMNSKDVLFLYFSIDDNINSWKSAEKRLGLKMDNSSLIRKDFLDVLKKQFKVETVPSYILIGKNNNIFSINAKRPSDPNLVKEIYRLIDK